MSAPLDTQQYDPMGFGDENQQRADAVAQQAGVAVTTKVRKSHWGTKATYKYFFPDQDDIPEHEREYIEFKKMNQGDRDKYQKMTSDAVLVHRGSGDARMRVDPARDREALMKVAVCGWKMYHEDGRDLRFTETLFQTWYKDADPEYIDELEKSIREHNKWLRQEMDLESARTERERLDELIAELEDKEAEKESSRNR